MEIEKKWLLVTIIGGALMIIGTASGLGILPLLIGLYNNYGAPFASRALGKNLARIITFILLGILWIIAGGGISVIIGSFLVLINLKKIGKLLITLGSGTGILGIILFIMWYITFAESVGLFFLGLVLNIYFAGIIMTIIGRRKLKNKETDDFDEDLSEPALLTTEPEPRISRDTIMCPACDSRNPKVATFCRNCGASLEYDLESYL